MGDIQFGTDGWRAIIADQFTFANVERVARATARFWQGPPTDAAARTVVIGYDRRFLSDQFARSAAAIFAEHGCRVVLTDRPTPTPAVSHAVKRLRALGGVMITASHNPPAFNGYKLKAAYGGPASPSDCAAVEALIDPPSARPPSGCAPGTIEIRDVVGPHLAAVKRQVDFAAIAKSGLRFAHDAMYGVGAGVFETLLAGTRCRVTTLNGRHDPLFGGINPEPIPRNYAASSAYLRRNPHDLCLVTDGDADRIGGMDGRGRPLSTHQIICLLLEHLHLRRGARGRMIKALTTTSMVDKICAEHGIELVETGVGFKHITTEMLRGNVLLGAEESGGIGFPGHLPERDGILAGMMLLEMLAGSGRSVNRMVADLERRYGPHRYARLDLAYPVERRAALMEQCRRQPPARLLRSPVVSVNSSDGIKYTGANGCWLMLRASGTEPIVRVYAEAGSDAEAGRLLRVGEAMAREVRLAQGRPGAA